MSKCWNEFLNNILINSDDGSIRRVAPIDNNDKRNIVLLGAMEALVLWDIYFSDTVKYALLFEHTYDEPVMIPIFDESESDPENLADTYKEILRSMHLDETPILIYWNSCTALNTTWGMFVKYWNNFFYYPEDAVIYVNQDQVYFYNEMILKKIDKSKLKEVSGDSIFNCLQKLKNDETKKAKALDSLFDGISSDTHFELYSLFHGLSEGLRAIKNDDNRKEYMEYCHGAINSTNLIITDKSYSKESLQYLKTSNYFTKKQFVKTGEKIYELLKKIIAENLEQLETK